MAGEPLNSAELKQYEEELKARKKANIAAGHAALNKEIEGTGHIDPTDMGIGKVHIALTEFEYSHLGKGPPPKGYDYDKVRLEEELAALAEKHGITDPKDLWQMKVMALGQMAAQNTGKSRY